MNSRAIVAALGISIMAAGAAAAGDAPSPAAALFGQLPQMTQVTLAPDGGHIAWITVQDGRKHALIAPLGSRERQPIMVPPIKMADIRWIRWANDGWLLVSYGFDAKRRRVIERTTETRLFAMNVNGDEFVNMARPVSAGAVSGSKNAEYTAQIQDSIIDMLPDDPDHILTELNDDQDFESGFAVRKVDVATGRYSEVDRMRWITDWTTDRSHQLRLAAGYHLIGQEQRKISLYRDPDSNEWVDLLGTPFDTKYNIVEFTDDPRIAYVTGSGEDGRLGLYRFDMQKQTVLDTVFANPDYDLDDLLFDPVSYRLAGVSFIGASEQMVYFDDTMARLQAMVDATLPGRANRIVSSSRDRNMHVVYSASETDAGVFYLLDLAARRLSKVGARYEGIDPAAMASVEAVRYTARDGLAIEAFLTVPKGHEAKGLPTVVLPHGGPWARDYKTFDYLAQFLAAQGYVVFQPNFRGSTGYGQAFQKAGTRQWGLAMQDDVTDGARWLIDQGVADPARMCVVGLSYGGYAALMGAVKTPELFTCAASINGVTDLIALIADDKHTIGAGDWIASIGDPGGDRAILKETSPARQADKIKVPVLLVQAKDDMRIEYEQARDMAKAIRRAGGSVDYLELADGGHSLEIEASRVAMLDKLGGFLAAHLGAK